MPLYHNRPNRYYHHQESALIRRLAITAGILLVLIIIFLLWGVQFLVGVSEVAGNVMRKDIPTPARSEPIFPPRLESLNSATNSATLTIKGAGRPGLEVEIFQNAESLKKTIIGSDGLFSFDSITLKEGKNTFMARQKDSNGKISQASEDLSITYDKQPPKVEISEPEATSERKGPDQKELKVSGKTEEGTSVTVNDRWVAVNAEGAFANTVSLNVGENTITIVVTDAAGNITKVTRKATYAP